MFGGLVVSVLKMSGSKQRGGPSILAKYEGARFGYGKYFIGTSLWFLPSLPLPRMPPGERLVGLTVHWMAKAYTYYSGPALFLQNAIPGLIMQDTLFRISRTELGLEESILWCFVFVETLRSRNPIEICADDGICSGRCTGPAKGMPWRPINSGLYVDMFLDSACWKSVKQAASFLHQQDNARVRDIASSVVSFLFGSVRFRKEAIIWLLGFVVWVLIDGRPSSGYGGARFALDYSIYPVLALYPCFPFFCLLSPPCLVGFCFRCLFLVSPQVKELWDR